MTEEERLRLSRISGMPFAPQDFITPIGLDLKTGGRNIDLSKQYFESPLLEPAQPSEPAEAPDYGTPTLDDIVEGNIKYQEKLNPILAERNRLAADEAIRQSQRQAAALFPYLDLAGERGTERALSASQRYRAFKEQLPSSVQAIMASKQAQQESASNAFLNEAMAAAQQQQAATGFASLGTTRYAGRRIA